MSPREQLAEPLRAPISSIARNSASPSPNRSHGASIRPFSTHSIAHAIVPPAEIVSSPTSSQRELAAITASASLTPHSGPSANTFSYSIRVSCPPAPCRYARTQSSTRARIPGDLTELADSSAARTTRRQTSRPRSFVSARRDRVEREQVGHRAELSVLGGSGPERRSRSSFGGDYSGGIGRRHLGARADEDRLATLRSHHRAESAPAGVATVMRDRCVAHDPLPCGTDRRDPPRRTLSISQRCLYLSGRQPPQILGGLDPDRAAVDHHHGRLRSQSPAARSRRDP